jgi:hypothetical protein
VNLSINYIIKRCLLIIKRKKTRNASKSIHSAKFKERQNFKRNNLSMVQSHLRRHCRYVTFFSDVTIWCFNCNPVFFLPQKSADNGFIHLGSSAKPHKVHSQVLPRCTNSLTDTRRATTSQLLLLTLYNYYMTFSSLFFPFTDISRFIALLLLFSYP